MEIEQLRKELNQLLENIVEHSQDFSDGRQIPSLEIGAVLGKINKMQEKLIVLRHLIETEEQNKRNKAREQASTLKETKEPTVIVEKVAEILETQEITLEPITENIEEEEIIEEAIADTIIETMTTENNNSVADQIQQSSITKLVDAFTLNDRYLYANELFNKDMSAFNELIKTIDNCISIDEAQSLFNKTGATYNWDTENKLVSDFMNLIERRFI